MKWTLEMGLNLVRALQEPSRKYGYHVTLGGGVLNNGESEKDIDLYFLPMGTGKDSKPGDLVSWLIDLWGENIDTLPEYAAPEPGMSQSKFNGYRYKIKFIRAGGDRIDIFVL